MTMGVLIDFSLLDPATPMGFAAGAAFKASLLLLLAGALTAALSRGPAAARHLLWTLGITGALALPLVSFALPWSWEVLPAGDARPELGANAPAALARVATAREEASEATYPGALAPSQEAATSAAPAAPARREQAVLHPAAAQGSPLADPSPAGGRASSGFPFMTVLGVVWALGAGLLLLHQVAGRLALFVLARNARPLGDPVRVRVFESLVQGFGLERPVRLLVSERTPVPMTWGLFSPVILVPAEAAEWSHERLRLVLQHELAHVRRLDAFTHALGRAVCAIYWFNPLVWWAAERLRSESELASDDCVLRRGERASAYAGHLLELVTQTGRRTAPVGALPLADRSRFEGRLLAILEPARAREGLRAGTTLAVSAAGALAVVLLAAVSPAGASEEGGEPADAVAVSSDSGSDVDDAPLPRSVEPPAPPLPDVDWDAPEVSVEGWEIEAVPAAAWGSEDPKEEGADAWAGKAREAVSRVASGQERLDSAAVAALVRALREDQDAEVRKTAAWALGQIEDRAATAALGQALRSDTDVEVRRTAAWALGQIEDPASAEVLGEALSDEDVEVRRTALWALGQIEAPQAVGPLSRALSDPDPEVRKTAAWGLGQIESREAVGALTTALSDAEVEVREQAVWALGQIEAEESAGALAGALRDASPVVRRQAAWALGQIESAQAVDGLSAALRGDQDAEVRQQAAWALGQIEANSALPALAAALSDADPEVGAQAAWAIGQIEPSTAPPELIEVARSGSGRVRETALWALAQIEDPAAVPALVEALRDTDEDVRRQALYAITQIRDESAIVAIAELLQDPSPEVRAAAARALAGGGGPNPRPRPQPQPRPRPAPRPNG